MGINNNVTTTFTAKTSGFTSGVNKATNALGGMSRAFTRGASGTGNFISATRSVTGGIIGATVVLGAYRTAINGIQSAFLKSFRAVEDFNLNVAQSAALITSFTDNSKGPEALANNFEIASNYANDLQLKFIEINKDTLANYKQMSLVNRELNKQGVILDTNNEKQVTAFKTLTNTIAVLTAGLPNQNLQFAQEIRAVMEGVARQGNTLVLFLKAQLGPAWRATVDEWKRSGTFLTNISEYLKGFEQASLKFKFTWLSTSSALKTTTDNILRISFQKTFDVIISKLRDIDDYLQTNSTTIAKQLESGWNRISAAIQSIDLEKVKNIGKAILEVGKALLLIKAIFIGFNFAKSIVILAASLYSLLGPIGLVSTALVALIPIMSNFKDKVIANNSFLSVWKDKIDELNASLKRSGLESRIRVLNKRLAEGRAEVGLFGKVKRIPLNAEEIADANKELKTLADELSRVDNVAPNKTNVIFDYLKTLKDDLLTGKVSIDAFVSEYKTMLAELEKASVVVPEFFGPAGGPDVQGPGFAIASDSGQTIIPVAKVRGEAEQVDKIFKDLGKSFSSDFAAAFETILKDFEITGSTMEKLWLDILASMRQMVAKWLADQTIKAFIRFGLALLSGGTSEVGTIASVAASAPSYAIGTDYVPNDMLANIHKGEMIIPAKQASEIRSSRGSGNSETTSLLASISDQLAAAESRQIQATFDFGDEQMMVMSRQNEKATYRRKELGI